MFPSHSLNKNIYTYTSATKSILLILISFSICGAQYLQQFTNLFCSFIPVSKWRCDTNDRQMMTINNTTNINISKTLSKLTITMFSPRNNLFSCVIQTMVCERNPVIIVNGPIVAWPFYNKRTYWLLKCTKKLLSSQADKLVLCSMICSFCVVRFVGLCSSYVWFVVLHSAHCSWSTKYCSIFVV